MAEIIERRTRNSKTRGLGGKKYALDISIGAVHYQDGGWQDIDNYFEPALAPWHMQMLHDGYHIRVKDSLSVGQVLEFEKQGETVAFQPMALEWTNDLDQIQQISMPNDVTSVVTNPEIDLLPNVGVMSHQGLIKWNNAYGTGIDFSWQATPSRLEKRLIIDNFTSLPVPEAYIIAGGNPVLRLNLIFAPSNDLGISIDGEAWDKSSKKQTFKAIIFYKDGEQLFQFNPLRYWGNNAGLEDNEGQSIATVEKRGNSLYISIRVPYSWLQVAQYPVFIDTDVDEGVGANANDTRIYYNDSYGDHWQWSITSPLYMGYFNGDWHRGENSSLFTTVNIPNGATIDTAKLTLTAYVADSNNTVNFRIYGEAADNPSAPTDNDDYVARSRTVSVDWNAVSAWSNNVTYDTPEIKTIVQAIVDRVGWSANQNMQFFCGDYDDRSTKSSDRQRIAEDYSTSTSQTIQLHVEYTEGGETYELSITDGIEVGEVLAQNMIVNLALTDGISGGETLGQGAILNPVLTEGAVMGEALSALWIFNKLATDGITFGENILAGQEFAVSLTDGVVLADAISHLYQSNPVVTDGAIMGDTLLTQWAGTVVITDGVILADTPTGRLVLSLLLTDGVTLSDTTLFGLALSLSLADGISLGESATIFKTVLVQLADGVSLGEVLEHIYTTYPAISEGIVLSDTLLAGGAWNLSLTDGFTLGEALLCSKIYDLLLTDGFTMSDAALAVLYLRELARKYLVEIHDSSGNLVAVLEHAIRPDYTERTNQPNSLVFSLPADDIKGVDITLANEIWLRDYVTNTVVKKFLLNQTKDVRS